jgi:hypothetical protein
MSFALYLIGCIVFIGGLAWALVVLHVQATYIAIACLIALGLGIMGGVAKTRTKDISE